MLVPKSLKTVSVSLVFSLGLVAQQPGAVAPLTNQRIADLAHAGVQAGELLTIIRTAPLVGFDLTPVGTNQLLAAGVSEEIIRAMAAREDGVGFTPAAVAAAPAASIRKPSHRLRNWVIIGIAAGGAAYAGYALSNPHVPGATGIHF